MDVDKEIKTYGIQGSMRVGENDREAATQLLLALTRIVQLSKSGYSTMGGFSFKAGSKESLSAIRKYALSAQTELIQLLSGAGPTPEDAKQSEFPHLPASARGWINDVISRRTVLDDLVDALDDSSDRSESV